MMFFQPGKRKGNPSIRVVNVAKKSSSIVSLPTPLSDSCVGSVSEIEATETEQNEDCQNVEWDDAYESDCEIATVKGSYKTRKVRLSSNWEKIRVKLLQTSFRLEGFAPLECVVDDCRNLVETRCRDCSYESYYCVECCNNVHQNKFQFHVPELFKVCKISNYFPILIH